MLNLKILIKWCFIYFAGLIVNKFISQFILYIFCIVGFLTGFILRVIGKYPGKTEPLILDFSTFLLAIVILFLNKSINFKIGLFLIFLPHIVYNLVLISFILIF